MFTLQKALVLLEDESHYPVIFNLEDGFIWPTREELMKCTIVQLMQFKHVELFWCSEFSLHNITLHDIKRGKRDEIVDQILEMLEQIEFKFMSSFPFCRLDQLSEAQHDFYLKHFSDEYANYHLFWAGLAAPKTEDDLPCFYVMRMVINEGYYSELLLVDRDGNYEVSDKVFRFSRTKWLNLDSGNSIKTDEYVLACRLSVYGQCFIEFTPTHNRDPKCHPVISPRLSFSVKSFISNGDISTDDTSITIPSCHFTLTEAEFASRVLEFMTKIPEYIDVFMTAPTNFIKHWFLDRANE